MLLRLPGQGNRELIAISATSTGYGKLQFEFESTMRFILKSPIYKNNNLGLLPLRHRAPPWHERRERHPHHDLRSALAAHGEHHQERHQPAEACGVERDWGSLDLSAEGDLAEFDGASYCGLNYNAIIAEFGKVKVHKAAACARACHCHRLDSGARCRCDELIAVIEAEGIAGILRRPARGEIVLRLRKIQRHAGANACSEVIVGAGRLGSAIVKAGASCE